VPDRTVIYYTANQEKPEFEQRIIRSLRHASRGVPIVSVSQQPMNLGTNICVGDVGRSPRNAFRQLQVGAMAAKTRYVCPAEADMLYPKKFFQFVPPRDDVFYLASPLYVCFCQRGIKRYFAPKPKGSESAMVVNREFLIAKIQALLGESPKWNREDEDKLWLVYRQPKEAFRLSIPVVTFKTNNNMHRRTPHDLSNRSVDIPHYGNAASLIRRYGL
jgi:hypothetical protein